MQDTFVLIFLLQYSRKPLALPSRRCEVLQAGGFHLSRDPAKDTNARLETH